MVRVRLTLPLAAGGVAVLAAGALAAGSMRPAAPADLSAAPGPAPTAAQPQPTTTAQPQPATTAVPPQAPARVQRATVRTGWQPYARVGPVTLHFPGDVVEVVGLHQSGHDGAQQQVPVPNPARIGSLDSRARDTNPNGAADIVVDPTREVRAPVSGTVVRAGTYTLYCDHVDDYVVIEPAARPGWEVKLLHFEGLTVGKGDRVTAGVTVVGSRARVLPFASQVDKHTVPPHWPHLHVEVVDPSIPDRPSGSSCD